MKHKVIIGDSRDMRELEDESIHLVVTSPPYFNAPFDYEDFYTDYRSYKQLITESAKEIYRVMDEGRIVCVVCDDMLVEGKKYPIVADLTRIFTDTGFNYREKIVWRKPEGYIRISRRSGVLLQHPYPMYFYPDNIQESILIFQKGEFDYSKIDKTTRMNSKINTNITQKEKWYLSVWDITNVLPVQGRIEKDVAAFPEEIPDRLIRLFSYRGETVLDPFLGSGTTMKVARNLSRSSAGYEINELFLDKIKEKLDYGQKTLDGSVKNIEIVVRDDCVKYEPPEHQAKKEKVNNPSLTE